MALFWYKIMTHNNLLQSGSLKKFPELFYDNKFIDEKVLSCQA